MSKRHRDALAIQGGACNPSGIAHSILDACREIRAEPGGGGDITKDPAVRLMVHQLAFICGLPDGWPLLDYQAARKACESEGG